MSVCELTQLQLSCRLVPLYIHKPTRILVSVTHGSCFFSFSHKCKSRWSHSFSQLKTIPWKEGSSVSLIFVLPFRPEALKHVCKRKQFVCCFIVRINNKSIKITIRPKRNKQLVVQDNTVTNVHVMHRCVLQSVTVH
jgi:hypothetical protein